MRGSAGNYAVAKRCNVTLFPVVSQLGLSGTIQKVQPMSVFIYRNDVVVSGQSDIIESSFLLTAVVVRLLYALFFYGVKFY